MGLCMNEESIGAVMDAAAQIATAGNVWFCIYETATGLIRTVGNCPENMVDLQPVPDGCALLRAKATGIDDYVVDGVVTPRPANPATLSADGLTIENLPIPCRLFAWNQWYDCTDAIAEFDSDAIGESVIVSAFPYMDKTFKMGPQ